VMAELHKLQTKRTNWVSALLILAVSFALFVGAGFAQKWEALWLIIPVLFFHELGHYLAMRIFGYRNLRMFFIPFFGAAVSGQNYTAPGWKKVVVSLAGPLPGIVVGGVLGFAGVYYEKPMWVNAALLALALNGFNLLPVLPLDGGRVMHTILFARHHLLDVTFRVIAALALAGLGALTGDKILLYLGIFMLIGVHAAYKLAKIATELRRAGLRPADLPADHVIPPEVAEPIIDRIQTSFPRAKGPKMIAQHTLHVYETLATRPPGWIASIFLGAVHGGSFLLAIVIAIVMLVAQRGGFDGFGRFAMAAASMPQTQLDPTAIVAWDAPPAATRAAPTTNPAAAAKRNTIVATFDNVLEAETVLVEVKAQPPAGARAVLFGQSVLLNLPADDAAARRTWFERFDARTKQVFVQGEQLGATLSLSFLARTKEEADAIVAVLNDGVTLGGSMHAIPPWHPSDPRTTDERARHERARRTYAKLNQAASNTWESPRIAELSAKVTEAARRGDNDEATKLQKEQEAAYEEIRLAALQALLDSPDESIDKDFARRFIAIEKTKPDERYQKMVAELGPLMGQVAMVGDKPAPGADRCSARFGFASNEGPLVTVRSLNFADVSHGAPAFVAWLQKRGGFDFRYQFARGGPLDALDVEGLEEE
jgi:Zn-dependent protease